MIIRIPFQGFYNTELSDRVDMEVEWCELEWESVNYPETHESAAREYAKIWLHKKGLEGAFNELVSPREYNFDTDSLWVELTPDSLARIKSKKEFSDEFSDWVAENCKHSDGFYSYLPDDLNHWPDEWNERHYYAALLADEDSELATDILEEMHSEGLIEIITTQENR